MGNSRAHQGRLKNVKSVRKFGCTTQKNFFLHNFVDRQKIADINLVKLVLNSKNIVDKIFSVQSRSQLKSVVDNFFGSQLKSVGGKIFWFKLNFEVGVVGKIFLFKVILNSKVSTTKIFWLKVVLNSKCRSQLKVSSTTFLTSSNSKVSTAKIFWLKAVLNSKISTTKFFG